MFYLIQKATNSSIRWACWRRPWAQHILMYHGWQSMVCTPKRSRPRPRITWSSLFAIRTRTQQSLWLVICEIEIKIIFWLTFFYLNKNLIGTMEKFWFVVIQASVALCLVRRGCRLVTGSVNVLVKLQFSYLKFWKNFEFRS